MYPNSANARSPKIVKLVVLGESGAGKTSVLQRYITDNFSDKYKATIGSDFQMRQMVVDGETVTLQLWDTAGQERFRSLGISYYRGADACVLVCDVTVASTLDALQSWWEEFVFHACGSGPEADQRLAEVGYAVIANKVDMDAERELTPDRFERWSAGAIGRPAIPSFEVSAKTGQGVHRVFESVVRMVLDRRKAAAGNMDYHSTVGTVGVGPVHIGRKQDAAKKPECC